MTTKHVRFLSSPFCAGLSPPRSAPVLPPRLPEPPEPEQNIRWGVKLGLRVAGIRIEVGARMRMQIRCECGCGTTNLRGWAMVRVKVRARVEATDRIGYWAPKCMGAAFTHMTSSTLKGLLVDISGRGSPSQDSVLLQHPRTCFGTQGQQEIVPLAGKYSKLAGNVEPYQWC